MKKKLIFIIELLLLLIPTVTYAGDVKSTSIVGKSTIEKGQELKLTYYINFDGVNKNDPESDGIYQVVFEIMYDETILKPKKFYAEGFETVNYSEDGNTYIISILKDSIPAKHQCIDKVLFCSSYALEVTYEVIGDKVSSTNVGMGDIEIVYSSMTGEDKVIYDTYLTASSSTSQSSKTIKITKNEKNNQTTTKPATHSSNAYLKKLEIDGYKFSFKKDVFEYEIDIDDKVNELKVTVETEDKNATYKILGADDLKKYNNKVFITVMAEDGTTNTYTIRKQTKEEIEDKKEVIVEENDEDNKSPKVNLNFELKEEHIKLIAIGVGALIGLIIIYNIIRYFIDKKIDKALDDL